MTDVSGVNGSTAGTATQTPANTTNTASSGSAATGATLNETPEGTKVTITQRDGSKTEYTIPTMQPDGKGGWISTPSAGMADLAKVQNRKYGMQLDANDFMQLLVAQLRYQDPSKPADTAAMMQQTASMAMIERVNELAGAADSMTKSSEALAKANEQLVQSNTAMTQHLGALLAQQSLAAAIGLIGQKVDYTDPAGGEDAPSKTGVVESVKVGADGPIISVNGQDVPIANVTGVSRSDGNANTGSTATSGTTPESNSGSDPAPDGTAGQAPAAGGDTPTP